MLKFNKRIIINIFVTLIFIAVLLLLGFGMLRLPYKLPPISGDIIKEGDISVGYNKKGISLAQKDATIFTNAYSVINYGKKTVKTSNYSDITFDVKGLSDEFGNGSNLIIKYKDSTYPEVITSINIYDNGTITLKTTVNSDYEISVNNISPIVVDTGKIALNGYDKFLEVPFDNDSWDTYDVKSLLFDGDSSEVGCFMSSRNNKGYVIGAITHKDWKNKIIHNSVSGRVKGLQLLSGAKTQYDESEHGSVKGKSVSSETFYMKFSDDWQKGMTEFAEANTRITPKKETNLEGVPVGFNSWGVIQTDLNLENAKAVSDEIKVNYQSGLNKAGEKIFINLDSYWDNMTDGQLREFVSHCKSNGQEAGIYWAPFVSWHGKDSLNKIVEGSDSVKYSDVILKKSNGKQYGNNIDGCYPLDITHPAVIRRMEVFINKFIECGFTYIKFDFMSHGALEGLHYDTSVTTGIQAYHIGMQQLDSLIGDKMFVNLSIAPIFPYEYANGRRIACDAYYGIRDTEYTMNSLSYGFWLGEIYDYPDPDHIVLWGKDGKADIYEAQSRMISGIISGTSLLFGDDFSINNNIEKNERLSALINNADLMKVAGYHKIFKPIFNGNYNKAAEIYELRCDGKIYYAVFNYGNKNKNYDIVLSGKFNAKELISGEVFEGNDILKVSLSGKQALLYEIILK